jgi:hypothetical protein
VGAEAQLPVGCRSVCKHCSRTRAVGGGAMDQGSDPLDSIETETKQKTSVGAAGPPPA